MAKRSALARVAEETVAILRQGFYTAPGGARVDLSDRLAAARAGTRLYRPDELPSVHARARKALAGRPPASTVIEVVNETTLAAAARLLGEGHGRVLALNFASAKNPGGGFLNGSQAQEESLARASGLYGCIAPVQPYYDANRGDRSCLYTDHLIYSPAVPVFRDDEDALLEQPYAVSFLTAPAVNAGAVRKNEPDHRGRIEPVMRQRINHVLAIAAERGYEALVLGAWGCGVFRNDPEAVARWFHEQLAADGPFGAAFGRVVFAVFDQTEGGQVIRPFQKRFASP